MLLLLQFSLQVGDAVCMSEHGDGAVVAMEMGLSDGMVSMEMPVETHPPCGDADVPISCDGPWAPSACATMAACHSAMTVSSAMIANALNDPTPVTFGEYPPLHASATVTPLPPPPRA